MLRSKFCEGLVAVTVTKTIPIPSVIIPKIKLNNWNGNHFGITSRRRSLLFHDADDDDMNRLSQRRMSLSMGMNCDDDFFSEGKNGNSFDDKQDMTSIIIPETIPLLSEILRSNRGHNQSSAEKSYADDSDQNGSAVRMSDSASMDLLIAENKGTASAAASAAATCDENKGKKNKNEQRLLTRTNCNKIRPTETETETETETKPWRAKYASSRRTHARIKHAAERTCHSLSKNHDKHRKFPYTPIQRATFILMALHNTPPQQCNECNLIHALTLTARVLPQECRNNNNNKNNFNFNTFLNQNNNNTNNSISSSSSKHTGTKFISSSSTFNSLWTKTLSILNDLLNDDRLTTRQLCNASWAIAKISQTHYQPTPKSDYSFNNLPQDNQIMEKWDLRIHSKVIIQEQQNSTSLIEEPLHKNISDIKQREHVLVMQAMENIAVRLIQKLNQQLQVEEGTCSHQTENHFGRLHHIKQAKSAAKVGELCMASWAFTSLSGPRTRPAGWDSPPRIAHDQNYSHQDLLTKYSAKDDNNVAIYQQLNDYSNKDQEQNKNHKYDKLSPSTTIISKGSILYHDSTLLSSSFLDPSAHIIDELFDVIALILIQSQTNMVEQCNWKELSIFLWSYAHSGNPHTQSFQKLINSLTHKAIERLRMNSYQQVHLQTKAGKLRTKVQRDEETKQRQIHHQFLPRDISQIAWALGILQSDDHHLSDLLVTFVDALSTFVINSYRPRTNNAFSMEQNYSTRPLGHWQSADLVQLALSLAHGRIDDQKLLESIFNEACISLSEEKNGARKNSVVGHYRHKQFLSWEISTLLWVQAKLHLTAPSGNNSSFHLNKSLNEKNVYSLFPTIASEILLQRIKSMHHAKFGTNNDTLSKSLLLQTHFQHIGLGVQELSNIAWSLTVLDVSTDESDLYPVALLKNIFHSISHSYDEARCKPSANPPFIISVEHAHQLWQALFLSDRKINPNSTSVEFESFLRQRWCEEKDRKKTSSARHKSLSNTLKLMGVRHLNEHDEDIDVAIVLKSDSEWTHSAQKIDGDILRGADNGTHRKVAVEFDGPHHFTRPNIHDKNNQELRALGHTVLKYRLLKKQGWTVVRVPYYEYDKIPFWASMERQRYLQRLLKTHANIRFSSVDVSEYKAPVANRRSRFD